LPLSITGRPLWITRPISESLTLMRSWVEQEQRAFIGASEVDGGGHDLRQNFFNVAQRSDRFADVVQRVEFLSVGIRPLAQRVALACGLRALQDTRDRRCDLLWLERLDEHILCAGAQGFHHFLE
jgi:hypothetical protein